MANSQVVTGITDGAAGGYPSVSVLLPVRNEEPYLARCLDSIIANTYPEDRLEILVVDGQSNDRSRNVVRAFMLRHPNIVLLENPKRITPAALNIGIGAANGEILIWMGAHAEYDKEYIRQSVKLLLETGAASTGGVITPSGEGVVGKAIAAAVSNPFGVGDARYRFAQQAGWVDTVFGGCWRREDVDTLGGFNEDWSVNQDGEFNFRLRNEIGGIYLSPDIKCTYWVRNSLLSLVRQYFRYGFWRVKTLNAHPNSLRWRQLVPPLFLLVLCWALFYARLSALPLAFLLLVYSAVSFFMAARYRKRQQTVSLLLVPPVFILMHTAWGAGFLAGIFFHGIPGLTRRE